MKPNEAVDIRQIVSGFAGVREFPGLADAWQWEAANGRFNFVLALTSDGHHALQNNTREYFDAVLVRATLVFARQHEPAILAASPVAILPDFSSEGSRFDAVVSIAPSIHEVHKAKHRELHAVTYNVYPAYRCEFSGRETPREAQLRHAKMVDSSDLRREPSPVTRLRYTNTRTRGGSMGDQRGLANPPVLFGEIKKLVDSPDSFVEFENYLGQVRKATWDDGLVLWNGAEARKFELPELLAWVERFVLHGAKDPDEIGA